MGAFGGHFFWGGLGEKEGKLRVEGLRVGMEGVLEGKSK